MVRIFNCHQIPHAKEKKIELHRLSCIEHVYSFNYANEIKLQTNFMNFCCKK